MRRYLLLLTFVMLTGEASAEEKRDVKLLAATIAGDVIAPKFAALDKAFAAQADAWDHGCGQAEALQQSFHAAYDAWGRAEFFRSGPLAQQTRAERIDYWPDPRNATDKGLKALLALPAASDITQDKVANDSVAIQGLPALERLIFAGDGAQPKSLGEKECAAGRAIAHNLSSIAAALDKEWNDPATGEAARLKGLSSDEAKARESVVALLTDLATGIRIIEDKKIAPLLGAKGNPPNPHAAKSWRSGRSQKDIEQNLASLVEAFTAISAFAPDAATSVTEKLKDASAALAAADDPNRVIGIVAAINNAKYYAIDVLPAEVGVTLGFNSLDGD